MDRFNGMDLLFGDDDADLVQTQDRRPAPTPRPAPTQSYGQQRPRPQAMPDAPALPQQNSGGVAPGYSVKKSDDIPRVYSPSGEFVAEEKYLDAAAQKATSSYYRLERDGASADVLDRAREVANEYLAAQGRPIIGRPEAKQPQRPQEPEKINGMDLLFGDDEPAPQADQPNAGATQPQQQGPTPERESPTGNLLSDAYNYLAGNQDEKYAGVKRFSELRDFGRDADPLAQAGVRTSKVLGATDAQYADVIKQQLGDKFVRFEQDKNGLPLVVFRADDGKEEIRYVNTPGLDLGDVDRAISGAIPYVATGAGVGSLMKGAGYLANVAGQAVTAGVTSLFGDAGNVALGSEQGVDIEKAATVAGFAGVGQAAAPAVGALWRRFVVEPRLYDSAKGQLTEAGKAAARKIGIDPDDLTSEIAKEFSKQYAGNPARAGRTITDKEFQIPVTQGQITKDKFALTNEEIMRRRGFGEAAQRTIEDLDNRQVQAIGDVVRGTGANRPSIAGEIAPDRTLTAGTATRGELGDNVRAGLASAKESADEAVNEAWKGVGNLKPLDAAIADLPAIMQSSLSQRGISVIDDTVTPAAARMAKEIDSIISGETPAAAADWLKAGGERTFENMRRRMLDMYGSASTPTDKRAAKALYDGFNDWITEAAEKGLVAGDVAEAAQAIAARDVSKEMLSIFKPSTKGGKPSPAQKIISDILDDDGIVSPERIVSRLFGESPTAAIPKGSEQAIVSIKRGIDTYMPGDAGKLLWNDIRLANWSRLVTDKKGDVFTPGVLQSNLKTAFQKQGSLMKTLYTPAELGQMRRFIRALDDVVYKPPNASGSGVTNAAVAGRFGQAFLALMNYDKGPLGLISQQILAFGVKDAIGRVAAGRAVSNAAKTIQPVTGLYGSAAGATIERD